MPLKMRDKLYKRDEIYFLPHLLAEVYTVKNPPMNHVKITDPNTVILPLEQEIGILKKGISPGKMRYLGTEELAHCVLLLLDNGNEFLAMHVNSANVPEMDTLIAHFDNKENIKATLIGGAFDDDFTAFSENYVLQILIGLINCSETITLESQQIIEHNRIELPEIKSTMQDRIINRAKILYKKIFSEDIPSDMLNHFRELDFEKENVIESIADIKRYAKLLAMDQLVSVNSNKVILTEKENLSKKEFIKMVEALFSQQGFKSLEGDSPSEFLYPGLRNIVFDTQTRELHRINEDLETPYALLRKAFVFDPKRSGEYFLAFDGKQYHKPALSDSFVQQINGLMPKIKEGILTNELVNDIKATITETAHYQIQPFATLVVSLENELSSRATAAPLQISSSQANLNVSEKEDLKKK